MDFNHPATFSITFNTTSASGALACIAITTIDDRVLEGDHDFSISLTSSNLEDDVQLSTTSVTAAIEDNDSRLACMYQVVWLHILETLLLYWETASEPVQVTI